MSMDSHLKFCHFKLTYSVTDREYQHWDVGDYVIVTAYIQCLDGNQHVNHYISIDSIEASQAGNSLEQAKFHDSNCEGYGYDHWKISNEVAQIADELMITVAGGGNKKNIRVPLPHSYSFNEWFGINFIAKIIPEVVEFE